MSPPTPNDFPAACNSTQRTVGSGEHVLHCLEQFSGQCDAQGVVLLRSVQRDRPNAPSIWASTQAAWLAMVEVESNGML